jgi:hypothetical protein
LPKRHKIRNNKLLLTFVKNDDAGIYKCTTVYDECYKFRVTIDADETKVKENKKEKKTKAKVPTIKLFKSVNDQSKSQQTTTEEVEYEEEEEDYNETASNATEAIKTTTSNIEADDADEGEDDQEEEIATTTTPTSEVEYYDDDEPSKVTVTSGSVAELVCGGSTQYDEYIDWGRPDKVIAYIYIYI